MVAMMFTTIFLISAGFLSGGRIPWKGVLNKPVRGRIRRVAIMLMIPSLFVCGQKINLSIPVTTQDHRFSQIYDTKFFVGLGTMVLAGGCDAVMQVLTYDYDDFKKTFPDANDEYWDPAISWQNKWKNGDPSKGEKYFGSSTIFCPFTDGWHFFQTWRNCFIATSITINLIPDKRSYTIDYNGDMKRAKGANLNRKWWVIGSKLVLNWAAFNIGKEVGLQVLRN